MKHAPLSWYETGQGGPAAQAGRGFAKSVCDDGERCMSEGWYAADTAAVESEGRYE